MLSWWLIQLVLHVNVKATNIYHYICVHCTIAFSKGQCAVYKYIQIQTVYICRMRNNKLCNG